MEFNYAPSTRRLKESLRASDLASNSPFNGRNSKPDYLLARSITNVTYFHDPGGKNRVSLLCTFCLREIKCLCRFIFCLKRRVQGCQKDFSGLYDLTLIVYLLRSNFFNCTLIFLVFWKGFQISSNYNSFHMHFTFLRNCVIIYFRLS